jgi:hypothetical protein
MTRNDFIKAINNLGLVKSIQGKIYSNIAVKGGKVWFIRGSTGRSEAIDLEELYQLFLNETDITTTVARNYITGRVYSPAVAILRNIGDNLSGALHNYNETHHSLKSYKQNQGSALKAPKIDDSDEARFFEALADVLGYDYLKAKKLGKPVTGNDVFLSNSIDRYDFDSKASNIYSQILDVLLSDRKFSGENMAHHIDGMIVNHPQFGNRIVEFDEEQHFTPARSITLDLMNSLLCAPYFDEYLLICEDLNYFNNEVLLKHRIKHAIPEFGFSFSAFTKWISNEDIKSSGYIEAKAGFPYKGGRISQRAYYDSLRDTAHLSPHNSHLNPAIRFAKKRFEDEVGKTFKRIPVSEVARQIEITLTTRYLL